MPAGDNNSKILHIRQYDMNGNLVGILMQVKDAAVASTKSESYNKPKLAALRAQSDIVEIVKSRRDSDPESAADSQDAFPDSKSDLAAKSQEKINRRAAKKRLELGYVSFLAADFYDERLTVNQWRVIMYIASKVNRYGKAGLIQKEIADVLSLSESQITKAISGLIERDILRLKISKYSQRVFSFNPRKIWNVTLERRNGMIFQENRALINKLRREAA